MFFLFDELIKITIRTGLKDRAGIMGPEVIATRPWNHPAGPSGIHAAMHSVQPHFVGGRAEAQGLRLAFVRSSVALHILPAILFHKSGLLHRQGLGIKKYAFPCSLC